MKCTHCAKSVKSPNSTWVYTDEIRGLKNVRMCAYCLWNHVSKHFADSPIAKMLKTSYAFACK